MFSLRNKKNYLWNYPHYPLLSGAMVGIIYISDTDITCRVFGFLLCSVGVTMFTGRWKI